MHSVYRRSATMNLNNGFHTFGWQFWIMKYDRVRMFSRDFSFYSYCRRTQGWDSNLRNLLNSRELTWNTANLRNSQTQEKWNSRKAKAVQVEISVCQVVQFELLSTHHLDQYFYCWTEKPKLIFYNIRLTKAVSLSLESAASSRLVFHLCRKNCDKTMIFFIVPPTRNRQAHRHRPTAARVLAPLRVATAAVSPGSTLLGLSTRYLFQVTTHTICSFPTSTIHSTTVHPLHHRYRCTCQRHVGASSKDSFDKARPPRRSLPQDVFSVKGDLLSSHRQNSRTAASAARQTTKLQLLQKHELLLCQISQSIDSSTNIILSKTTTQRLLATIERQLFGDDCSSLSNFREFHVLSKRGRAYPVIFNGHSLSHVPSTIREH